MGKRAEEALATAKLLARDARANLKSQFIGTRERLRPDRLKQDAIDTADHYVQEAKEVTVATIKEHPAAFGASFLGTLAFWYRKPIARQVEHRSPDAIDGVGDVLERLRDWVAPQGWESSRRTKTD